MNDIAIVGGGIVGGAAALALSAAFPGRVVHIAPKASGDERTTALLNDAVDLLRAVGVWRAVEESSSALRTMRLLDGSRRLIRSRPVEFHASEVGLEAFGYNVRNDVLTTALAETEGPRRVEATVDRVERTDVGWFLELSNGDTHAVDAVIGADGRNSIVREAAGIGTRRWSYPQVALVTTFAHDRPHMNVSTEFHTETGPLTQVPLPAREDAPHRSSLVWVVRPEQVDRQTQLSTAVLSDEIAERTGFLLGGVRAEAPLTGYPLVGLVAKRFGADGAFLVGEAAHVFPPIGAQGANLGFRDVADCVDAMRTNENVVRASEVYDRKRSADIHARTAMVDVLNRSLLTDFLPVQMGKALGTQALAASGPLRRFAMRWGLSPSPDRYAGNGSTGNVPAVMK